MDLGNSVTFRNNNMVDSIKLGAKFEVNKLPKAQCLTENNKTVWGWNSEEGFEKIRYETYLELKAEDICGSKGAGGQQGNPMMQGGQGQGALGTPCIQAKKEKDLLTKMSQAVAEVFKPYEPLIQLCKKKIHDDNKTEECTPNVQDIDVLKNSCELSYEDVKDKLDLYIKSGNLELKESNTYDSFDNEVKTVAQAAFLKAGGVCLSPIENTERVDWNSCKIVSNMEADQLLKETGASIVIFIATLVWGLVLAALIWAALKAYKAWQKRRQSEQLLDSSA